MPLSQSKFENLQNSSEKLLSIKENITMKVLLNKKANFFELKQVTKKITIAILLKFLSFDKEIRSRTQKTFFTKIKDSFKSE